MGKILVSPSTYSTMCDKYSKNLLCLLYLFLVIKGGSSFFPLPRRGPFPCWHVYVTPIDTKMAVSIKLSKKLLWGNFHECEIMGIKTNGKVSPHLCKLPGFLEGKSLEIPLSSPLPFSEMHFYLPSETMVKLWSVQTKCFIYFSSNALCGYTSVKFGFLYFRLLSPISAFNRQGHQVQRS